MKRYPIPEKLMAAKCATCPFNDNGDLQVRASVERRILADASQMCHSTGWPKGTHLCRGARDFQLQIFYRMGFLPEPNDEAWAAKRKELGI
jgi:hypothetical protein